MIALWKRFLLCLLFATPSLAIDMAVTNAEASGFKAAGLEQLRSHFRGYVDDGKLAGYASLVARKGKLVHTDVYGKQDIAAGTSLRADSIYRIYSMTKPITSVALMMLYEEGLFKLDDPIAKHLPGFANQRVFSGLDENGNVTTVSVNEDATVLDLMRHTAGLTYGFFSETPVDMMYRDTGVLNGLFGYDPDIAQLRGEEPTALGFANGVGELPLLYQPGEAWVYSVAVDVQGALIEKLSGLGLEAFFEERIFKPLGMTDTGFYVKPEWTERFVELYALDQDKKLVPYRGNFYSDFKDKPRIPSGGGGLLSTLSDYWRFTQMVANGGELDGVRLLKPETVDLMRRDHLPEQLKGIAGGEEGLGFGLNFAVVKDVSKQGGKGSKGEYFWGGMANTLFWIDPKEDIVAILMVNILPSGIYPLRNEMRGLVYDALAD